ncbi:AbrB/MazE/SpoVT family DNA-binding domain-containing protein [Candidatus Saccharibacteria bacterium]|nr:AbrB/MazE/SpoVT family DNA-binding domain-containing protein [Candidatus Saccharibacteria bacterium]
MTVSSQGQVTLPAKLRQALGVKPGDSITITTQSGEVVLERSKTLREKLANLRRELPNAAQLDIENHRGQTVNELRNNYMQSHSGNQLTRGEYGL